MDFFSDVTDSDLLIYSHTSLYLFAYYEPITYLPTTPWLIRAEIYKKEREGIL